MNKLFATNRSKCDPKLLDRSVAQIERDVQLVSNETNGLRKKLRIETKRLDRIGCDLNEEIEKKTTIDRQIEDKTTLKENIIEEMNRKSKYVESIVDSNRVLEQMIKSLAMESSRKSEEQKQQIIEFEKIRDEYRQQLDSRRNAYQSAPSLQSKDIAIDSNGNSTQFTLKKNELKDIESNIQLIGSQIKELSNSKSSKSLIDREMGEEYADPIQVIVEIARIKLISNQLEKVIANDSMRRQYFLNNYNNMNDTNDTNEDNIETIGKSSETCCETTERETQMETNSPMESNSRMDSFVDNEKQMAFEANCPPISSTSGVSMFSEPFVPQMSSFGFGEEMPKTDDNRDGQNSPFSLFANTSNANQSLFAIFGKSPPEDHNRSMRSDFNVFSNASTDGSVHSNTSPKSLNLFK